MGEVEFDGEVAEVDALGIQEFLVDGVEEGEVVLFDGFPELGRVFFAEEHYGFAGAVAEVVSLCGGEFFFSSSVRLVPHS